MNYLSQSWLINRRHALRAMGTCIALPMLECMTPLKAAEKISTPKRSAFIYLANGVHSLNYQITESGPDYKFSRSLKPLEKHRNSITPISGLCHRRYRNHHKYISIWLTGGMLAPGSQYNFGRQKDRRSHRATHRYPSIEIAIARNPLPGRRTVYNCLRCVIAVKFSRPCSRNRRAVLRLSGRHCA